MFHCVASRPEGTHSEALIESAVLSVGERGVPPNDGAAAVSDIELFRMLDRRGQEFGANIRASFRWPRDGSGGPVESSVSRRSAHQATSAEDTFSGPGREEEKATAGVDFTTSVR